MPVWSIRKEVFYGNGPVGEVSQNNPTPECKVNGTELVLYDGWMWVIYLFYFPQRHEIQERMYWGIYVYIKKEYK